jgi:MerR family transcriptional regulator, redox-sensitive transcriptional activator SoxR
MIGSAGSAAGSNTSRSPSRERSHRAAGVRKSLLRYYESIGLLPPAARGSGQRRYDPSVLRRLAVIDVAQRAGLSLDEIGELLEIGSDPFSPRLRALTERRLPEWSG